MSFGRDADTFAVGGDLHGSAACPASAGADGRAAATSSESADNCAENSATADDSSGTFAARFTFLLNIAGGDAIGFALIGEAIECDGEFTGTVKPAGGVCRDEFQVNVEPFGYDEIVFQGNGGVQRSAEDMARLAGGGVDAVPQ